MVTQGGEGSKSPVWMHWWGRISVSAFQSHILAKYCCRRRRAGWGEWEWSAWLNTRGSIWEERRVSATCKNRSKKAEILSLWSRGPAWMVLTVVKAARFTLGSPTTRQLALLSCPARQCVCLQVAFQLGVFSSWKYSRHLVPQPQHCSLHMHINIIYSCALQEKTCRAVQCPCPVLGLTNRLALKVCQGAEGAPDGKREWDILSAQGCAVPKPTD